MQYGNYQEAMEERFRQWLQLQSNIIEVAIEAGYTREEAIELLKVYAIVGIASRY